jgi:hypothetical protein
MFSEPLALTVCRVGVLRFDIGVTRVERNSGVTGNVLQPKVSYEQTRILIETDHPASLHESSVPPMV